MLLFWREDYFPEASGTDDAGAAIWVNCFGLHRKMSSSKQCKLIEDKLDIFFTSFLICAQLANGDGKRPCYYDAETTIAYIY